MNNTEKNFILIDTPEEDTKILKLNVSIVLPPYKKNFIKSGISFNDSNYIITIDDNIKNKDSSYCLRVDYGEYKNCNEIYISIQNLTNQTLVFNKGEEIGFLFIYKKFIDNQIKLIKDKSTIFYEDGLNIIDENGIVESISTEISDDTKKMILKLKRK